MLRRARSLRSVEHNGGLDNWLVKTSDDKLSLRCRRLKRDIRRIGAAALDLADLAEGRQVTE